MQDALMAICADPIVGPAELYVAEVIYPEELGFLQDRFADLEEVNYLVKRMDSFFGDEDTPFQRPYDGQTFPAYFYDPNVLCVAKAEYNGKTEYLYFPCEEEAIDKAFARLGTTADEVKITLEDFNTDSPEWFGRFREIAAEEGVYELNKLIAVVNTADMDLKKRWSVAEYAEAENAEQLTRLARNIGCFTFIEGGNKLCRGRRM